jgi:hypothetical protein
MVQAYFKNIRSSIIKEIFLAKETINIAVYWFTNHELFDMIYQKQLSGVQCQLIIHNDYINNRNTGLPFQKFINAGGKFFFSDEENPMHNKFCLIDNQILINGSYNWTYYAENKNRENILIIKNEPEVINSFQNEFLQLIELVKPLQLITPFTKFEVEENNLLRNRDYLAHDIIYQAKESNMPNLVNSAFEIAPKNLNVQKIANNLGLIKKYKLKHSVGVSIINDECKFIANKGADIPATFTSINRTSYDNQIKVLTNLVYGENSKASQNVKIANMSLDRLPPKTAGLVEIKFIFSIDIEGNMRVEMMSLDTGKKQILTKSFKTLIEQV